MLEAAPFAELMITLSKNVASTAVNRVETCLDNIKVLSKASSIIAEAGGQDPTIQSYRNSEVLGFKNAYDALLNILVQDAQAIECIINEAYKRRLIQLDITTGYRDTWLTIRRIRREHEKTIQSMDIFLKDKIMQKSAEIGRFVREGNSGDKWSFTSAEEALKKLGETKNVNKMITVYDSVLSSSDIVTMHNEFVENYVSSQLALALRKSKLENSMMNSERIQSFSELFISNGIKEAAKLNRDGLATGYEEAKTYAERVNITVDEFRKLANHIDSIAAECTSKDCVKVKEYILDSTGQIVRLFSALNKVAAQDDANKFRAKIEQLYGEKLLPAMNTHTVQPAIKLILKTLPQARNPDVDEAYQFLNQFANNPLAGSDINSFNGTMAQVSKYTKKLLQGFRCYRKIFQVIGNVLQGCKDGRQTFDELYTEHTSKADLGNSKCSEMVLMSIPNKNQIQQIVTAAARDFDFNADCRQNQQNDDEGFGYYDDGLDYDNDEEESLVRSPWKLSGSQRFNVCTLRNATKSEGEIAKMVVISVEAVRGVRCKT